MITVTSPRMVVCRELSSPTDLSVVTVKNRCETTVMTLVQNIRGDRPDSPLNLYNGIVCRESMYAGIEDELTVQQWHWKIAKEKKSARDEYVS